MHWWFWLLIGIIGAYLIPILIIIIWAILYALIKGSKIRDLRKFCNHCKRAFVNDDYEYCGCCGRKLTHHQEYLKNIVYAPITKMKSIKIDN